MNPAPPPLDAQPFRPVWLLRHTQLQSALATKSPRRALWLRRGSRMEASATHHVLDCGDGVRLSGWHSPQPAGRESLGLCVLIHGWEGCHDSAYLYSMACRLHAAGYSVFRLNLRDHGGTHHLNRELFHSARMDEVLGALRAVMTLDGARPLYVIGFSLGGNFALRVALRGPGAGLAPRLCIGISPAIHPGSAMAALDAGPLLVRAYFMRKWRKTLRAKQRAWPGVYDFSAYAALKSFVEITARFAADFSGYGTLENYLAQYTLLPADLVAAPAPLAVITARDDSVIPFRHFEGLSARGSVQAFLATDHGGHCGFIENLRMESWAEARVLDLLGRAR